MDDVNGAPPQDEQQRRVMGHRLRSFLDAFDGRLTLIKFGEFAGISHSVLSKMQTGKHTWSGRDIWRGLERATGASRELVEGYFERGTVSLRDFFEASRPHIDALLKPQAQISEAASEIATELRDEGEDRKFVEAIMLSAQLILKGSTPTPDRDEVGRVMRDFVTEYRDLLSRQQRALKSARWPTKKRVR